VTLANTYAVSGRNRADDFEKSPMTGAAPIDHSNGEKSILRGRNAVLAASLIALILAACAGTMPLRDDADTLPGGGKAVALLTVTLKNAYKPSINLEPALVLACKRGQRTAATHLFRVDEKSKPATGGSESASRYFLRVALAGGEHEIVALRARFLHGS
jgi:hypothetical protein